MRFALNSLVPEFPDRFHRRLSAERVTFILRKEVDRFMTTVRTSTTTFRHRISFVPNNFTTIEPTGIGNRDNEPERESKQVPILQPRYVLVLECFALTSVLHVSTVSFIQADFVGTQSAMNVILLAPIDWCVVSIANIQPKNSFGFHLG